MLHSGVIVYINNDEKFTIPKIYTNGAWQTMQPHIYENNEWKLVGAAGCPMIFLMDANNNYVTDSNGNYILVKKM